MPFYQDIRPSSAEGRRTLAGLIRLRKQLKKQVPEKGLESNLLLATWNIREFGTPKYGGRDSESLHYIAEIIARFDIVAIQEVRKDLSTLKKLMTILGGYWQYIFTDVTEGRQGNEERLAYVYDTRKVRFGGLAGEMVIPPLEARDPVSGQTIYQPGKQLARTPYMCGFRSGWTNFELTTVHILYGTNTANDPDRIEEIKKIAEAISARADSEFEWSNNVVLLGDFNIYSRDDDTLKAITANGFIVPKELQSLKGSNVQHNKFYDQIAFKVRPHRFETTGKAGVFDYYESVYRLEDELSYAGEMGEAYHTTSDGEPRKDKTAYYKTYWRTFKMSDHLPMWVEIGTDHTDDYLNSKILPPQKRGDTPELPQ